MWNYEYTAIADVDVGKPGTVIRKQKQWINGRRYCIRFFERTISKWNGRNIASARKNNSLMA